MIFLSINKEENFEARAEKFVGGHLKRRGTLKNLIFHLFSASRRPPPFAKNSPDLPSLSRPYYPPSSLQNINPTGSPPHSPLSVVPLPSPSSTNSPRLEKKG